MSMTTQSLCTFALHRSMDEEERLCALRHVCLALPRMAHALPEQARQLGTHRLQA